MDSLIEFRKEKELTLQEMADKIGISKSMYEKIEYGDAKPSLKTMKKMKEVFNDLDINIFLQ